MRSKRDARGSFKPIFNEDQKKAALELGAAMGRTAATRHLGIGKTTFQQWTEELPEYWAALRDADQEAQRLGFARKLEDLADAYSALEFAALERAEKLIPTADAKELAALLKAMGGARGVAAVNARAHRGDPSDVQEIRVNFPAIERAAEALLNQAKQNQLPLKVPNLEETE